MELQSWCEFPAIQLQQSVWLYLRLCHYPSQSIPEQNAPGSGDFDLSERKYACKHNNQKFIDSEQRCPSQFIK